MQRFGDAAGRASNPKSVTQPVGPDGATVTIPKGALAETDHDRCASANGKTMIATVKHFSAGFVGRAS